MLSLLATSIEGLRSQARPFGLLAAFSS